MKLRVALVFSVCVISLSAASKKVRYDGFKVLRLTPKSQDHVKFLEKLKEKKGVLFWRGPSAKIGQASDVMIPPELDAEVLRSAQASGLENTEYIPNVQSLIDKSGAKDEKDTKLNWNQYGSLFKIYEFLEDQAAEHSDKAELITIGKSYEGKDIKVIKISKGGVRKPGIWIDSNIHAREWISGAVVTYLINELLNGSDKEVKSWTDDFDFYILPIVNPDGFEYSYYTDRLWRKTRSSSGLAACAGADANRNFGYKWLTAGASSNPCRETYAGRTAFSEVETQALANYFHSIATDIVGFFTIHSYGQLILFPYGVKDERLPQHDEYLRIGRKVANAIARRSGTAYTTGSITEVLYPASGGSIDWVKANYNTNLTFVFELRDTGNYGFLLPPDQIIPTSLEFIDGFKVIVDELRSGVQTPERIDNKKLLKMYEPMAPLGIDSQTFGILPTRLNSPIIAGFRRY